MLQWNKHMEEGFPLIHLNCHSIKFQIRGAASGSSGHFCQDFRAQCHHHRRHQGHRRALLGRQVIRGHVGSQRRQVPAVKKL